MGIRMALGAKRGDVVWMVMREGLLLVVAGIAIGAPAALAASARGQWGRMASCGRLSTGLLPMSSTA